MSTHQLIHILTFVHDSVTLFIVQTISTEYHKSSSPGGPPTGESVLTDVADNTQLGNKDRIRDKGSILHT